ncbi:hypothetical protein D3C83_81000 [compost metagenome]
MDVNRQLGRGAYGFDDGEADAEVGNEDAVHDVDMDEIGAGRFRRGDLFAEAAKVGRQD